MSCSPLAAASSGVNGAVTSGASSPYAGGAPRSAHSVAACTAQSSSCGCERPERAGCASGRARAAPRRPRRPRPGATGSALRRSSSRTLESSRSYSAPGSATADHAGATPAVGDRRGQRPTPQPLQGRGEVGHGVGRDAPAAPAVAQAGQQAAERRPRRRQVERRRSPAAPPSRGSAGRPGRGGPARSAARSTCRRRCRRARCAARRGQRARPRGPRPSPSSHRRRARARGARRRTRPFRVRGRSRPSAPAAAARDSAAARSAPCRAGRRRRCGSAHCTPSSTACQTGPKRTPGWPGPPASASSGMRAKTDASASRATRRRIVPPSPPVRSRGTSRVAHSNPSASGQSRKARAACPDGASRAPAPRTVATIQARRISRGSTGEVTWTSRPRAAAELAQHQRRVRDPHAGQVLVPRLEVRDDGRRWPRPPAAGRGRRWRRSPPPRGGRRRMRCAGAGRGAARSASSPATSAETASA